MAAIAQPLKQAPVARPVRKEIPPVLLPYQQDWCADMSDVAIWEKSRRVGASWCDAADSVLTAAAEHGMDALYIGYSEDMTREYIDACAMWAKEFHHAAAPMQEFIFLDYKDDNDKEPKAIKAFRIDFPSGSKVLALSSRPRSIRGKQGKVTIDEAAFHDDLAGLIKAALALLMWGGRVRILSSHNGVLNYFNTLVQDVRGGKYIDYTLHRTTLDDALADGLYERIALVTGREYSPVVEADWRAKLIRQYGAFADEELMVIPREGGGTWLARILIEANMYDAPILRWRPVEGFVMWPDHMRQAECQDWCDKHLAPCLAALSPAERHYFGEDFGRHVDLTVMAPMAVMANLARRIPFLVELSDVPYDQQRQIAFYILSRLPRLSGARLDRGGNGDFLSEVCMQKFGSPLVEGVLFNETWFRENTAPMKSAFEDKMILVPRDAEVLDDLRKFELIKGVPRIPDQRVDAVNGGKRHGDAALAILLAYVASCADFVPIEFQALGAVRESSGLADYALDG